MSEEHGLLFVEYNDTLVRLLSCNVQKIHTLFYHSAFPPFFPLMLKNTYMDAASVVTDSLLFINELSVQLYYYSRFILTDQSERHSKERENAWVSDNCIIFFFFIVGEWRTVHGGSCIFSL